MIKSGSVYWRRSEQLHKLVGNGITIINTLDGKVTKTGILKHTNFGATSGTRTSPGFYIGDMHLQIRGTEKVDMERKIIVYNFEYKPQQASTKQGETV